MNVLDQATAEVVAEYCRLHRKSRTDDHGREPLLTTKFGRHSMSAVRQLVYKPTQPCLRGGCPHDKAPPASIEFTATRASVRRV